MTDGQAGERPDGWAASERMLTEEVTAFLLSTELFLRSSPPAAAAAGRRHHGLGEDLPAGSLIHESGPR